MLRFMAFSKIVSWCKDNLKKYNPKVILMQETLKFKLGETTAPVVILGTFRKTERNKKKTYPPIIVVIGILTRESLIKTEIKDTREF